MADPRATPPGSLSWPTLVAVAAGATAGVALRLAVAAVVSPTTGAIPWQTLLVNVAGSLCLGFLVARSSGRSPLAEAFLSPGLLASFTTYSTFAVETNQLLAADPVGATAYAALSIAGGLGAATAGMAWGRR